LYFAFREIVKYYISEHVFLICFKGPSWPWSHGSWIYNYLCKECLSPLMLWVRISIVKHHQTNKQTNRLICFETCFPKIRSQVWENQVEIVIISLGNIFVFHRRYTANTILNAYIHNKYWRQWQINSVITAHISA